LPALSLDDPRKGATVARIPKWLKGCGCGCGALVLLGVLLLFGSSLFVMRPFKQAVADGVTLIKQYGSQEDYVPPASGAIAPARLETFLAVRSSLMEMCGKFERSLAGIRGLEQFDGQQEVDRGEVLKEALKVTRSALGLGPKLGEYARARNAALLAQGMGLGEYSYIYVLAYGGRLQAKGGEGEAHSSGLEVSSRVRQVLRVQLQNQLQAMDADPERWLDSPERGALIQELEHLRADPERLPWADGLPPAVAASLAPYHERLDDLFCAATAGFELSRHRMRVMGVQSD
jgi:hypothetical protein